MNLRVTRDGEVNLAVISTFDQKKMQHLIPQLLYLVFIYYYFILHLKMKRFRQKKIRARALLKTPSNSERTPHVKTPNSESDRKAQYISSHGSD